MFGAFETAAGAFAVVGVADVLVRTGRDLYSFLHDITDAPEEIARLREVIQETVVLHEASLKCQNDFNARSTVGNSSARRSLESASAALGRALQSLKLVIGKFKGTRTWSRVKFVLSDSKVKKAINTLEQAKLLLTNSLILACCELSALGNAEIEELVRTQFQKAGVETQSLFQALQTRSRAQHLNMLAVQDQNQQVLLSNLKQHQQQNSAKQDKNQKTLVSVQRTQVDILGHQKMAVHRAHHTQKQAAKILRTLVRNDERAVDASRVTTDTLKDLTSLMKQHFTLHGDTNQAQQSDRDISFLRERPDQIMAYLLPFQDSVDYAIDYIISQCAGEVSVSDAEWLRSEFEHLIGSASQEKALQYSNSTATSVDQWIYPEDTIGYLKLTSRQRMVPMTQTQVKTRRANDDARRKWASHKRTRRLQRTWLIQTNSGEVGITLPNRQNPNEAPEGNDKVGLLYTTTHNHSTVHIHARFLRDLCNATRPKIYTQLNIFVVLEGPSDAYEELLKSASLSEIDDALRKGVISPFHVTQHGCNYLLAYMACHCRVDVSDYLESQGIGQTSLNNDHIMPIIISGCSSGDRTLFIDKTLDRARDASAFAVHLALELLTTCCHGDHQAMWLLIMTPLKVLQRELFDEVQNGSLLDCFAEQDLSQNCLSVSQLASLIIESGACDKHENLFVDQIWNLLKNIHYDKEVKIEILGSFIRAGVGVKHIFPDGICLSMDIRRHKSWNLLCTAFEKCGESIEVVLSRCGSSWRLGKDRRQIWRANGCYGYEYILGNEEEDKKTTTSDYEYDEDYGKPDDEDYGDFGHRLCDEVESQDPAGNLRSNTEGYAEDIDEWSQFPLQSLHEIPDPGFGRFGEVRTPENLRSHHPQDHAHLRNMRRGSI